MVDFRSRNPGSRARAVDVRSASSSKAALRFPLLRGVSAEEPHHSVVTQWQVTADARAQCARRRLSACKFTPQSVKRSVGIAAHRSSEPAAPNQQSVRSGG